METKLSNQEIRKQRMEAARLKGTHTVIEWEEMKAFFNHTCVRCYGSSGLANVEKDHIVPIYQGGSDSIRNIQPMCARCNAAKGPENYDWRIHHCDRIGKIFPEKWSQAK